MVTNLSTVLLSATKNTAHHNTFTSNKVNKKRGFKLLFILLVSLTCTLLSSHALALSTVTAVVDKNPAMMNESILLTVTADDDIDRDALDTTALAKDFIVGQTRVSSQTSIINFDATRTTTWKIILIARKAGEYKIPALTIENVSSQPIDLKVIAGKKQGDNHQSDIFITSELSSNEVYVQQSLTLSIKLHFSVELHSASMDQPELTGAIIQKVGEDQQSNGIINGKRYRIIEQKFSVTPEQSGEFTIKAPVFSGEVSDGSSRRSAFRSFAQTKPVSVIGDDVNITVLPIPSNYPNNDQWLPTDLLTLHEEWQGNDDNYIVGEPITRTIRLTAVGLSEAQLPKLTMPNIRGIKVYPDQPELHSTLREQRLISQKVQNFALMPSVAGKFVIPEMHVSWFNTITKKVENATLPEQTIVVNPAPDNMGQQSPNVNNIAPLTQSTHNSSLNTEACEESTANQANSVTDNTDDKNTFNQLTWLLIILWLVTLLSWFIHVIYLKRNSASALAQPSKAAKSPLTNTNQYAALVKACQKNNADEALTHLLPWLQSLLTDKNTNQVINSVSHALEIINDEALTLAANNLQAQLYGKKDTDQPTSWLGKPLQNAIVKVNSNYQTNTTANQGISINP